MPSRAPWSGERDQINAMAQERRTQAGELGSHRVELPEKPYGLAAGDEITIIKQIAQEDSNPDAKWTRTNQDKQRYEREVGEIVKQQRQRQLDQEQQQLDRERVPELPSP